MQSLTPELEEMQMRSQRTEVPETFTASSSVPAFRPPVQLQAVPQPPPTSQSQSRRSPIMSSVQDSSERCPSCRKVVKEDLSKYDVHTNKWVAFDAILLIFKSFRHPGRSGIVYFGVLGTTVALLTLARFLMFPTSQLASNASGPEKMAAHAAGFIRPVVGSTVLGASSALGGSPVTVQEVNTLQANPQAVPVSQTQAPAKPAW